MKLVRPSWVSRADRTVAWGLQQCAASRSLKPKTTSLLLNPDWTAQRTQQATSLCGQAHLVVAPGEKLERA